MTTRVYRNIGWNGVFLVGQTAATLAVVPLLIRHTGDAGFGIYSFFLAMVTVSSLVQAGIDIAVARSVSRYGADHDEGRLQSDLSFSYLFCTLAGVVQAFILLALVRIPGLIEPASQQTAQKLSVIFAVSAIVSSPFNLSLGILVGCERFLARNLITCLPVFTGLLFAGSMHFNAEPQAILLYAMVVEAARFVGGISGLYRANILLPHLGRMNTKNLLRLDIISFQLKQVGNQAADYLFNTSDRLILQSVMGVVAVAHYAIADRPNVLAQAIVSSPLIALLPSLAAAAAARDRNYIQKVIAVGTRLYCWLTVPLLVSLLVSAPGLIYAWVGSGYADSGHAAQFFVLCLVVMAPFKIYSHYRLAEGSIGVMAASKLAYAPINILASILLSQRIGILGVVIPTAFFYALIYPTIWIASMIRRREFSNFLLAAGRSILATGVTLALALVVAHAGRNGNTVDTIIVTGVNVIIGGAIFATVGGGRGALRSRQAQIVPGGGDTSLRRHGRVHAYKSDY